MMVSKHAQVVISLCFKISSISSNSILLFNNTLTTVSNFTPIDFAMVVAGI